MTKENRKVETKKNERNGHPQGRNWEGVADYAKKIVTVPKEELDKKLAEEKRDKEGKRTG